MEKLSTLFALTCLSLVCGVLSYQNYDGYKVFRVEGRTSSEVDLIRSLDGLGYDFWKDPIRLLPTSADIMVTPERLGEFTSFLNLHGLKHSILVDDVETVVAEERARLGEMRQSPNMTWTEYHRMGTIHSWMDNLAASFPNLVSVETYGKSWENRDLKVLKVSTGGSSPKPAIWIDAGIHSREWISIAMNTFIINELVQNINHVDLRNGLDWYFVPMVNPDGYEYSHTNDRMWRKTRSNHTAGTVRGCDANRNFGFKWGYDDQGSSPSPSSETYRGPAAYSEPEAASIRDYILNRTNSVNWTAFVTTHSYSQLWMTPYGYTYADEAKPDDFQELVRVSEACVQALTSLYGTRYTTGNAAEVLYLTNGSSRDWAKGEGGFKYVYTIELRPTGANPGFILPPAQIIPTSEETWLGIQVLARHIMSSQTH